MNEQSWDPNRTAETMRNAMPLPLQFGLNAAKPLFEYQKFMLRLWANNCELVARNFEKGIETFASIAENHTEQVQQHQQRAAE